MSTAVIPRPKATNCVEFIWHHHHKLSRVLYNIRDLSDNRTITYCHIIALPLIPCRYWMCIYLHVKLKKNVEIMLSHQKHIHTPLAHLDTKAC